MVNDDRTRPSMADQIAARIDTTPIRDAVKGLARRAQASIPVRVQVGEAVRRPALLPLTLVGVAATGLGAFVAWVFDPRLGRGRRAVMRDRVAGGARRVGRWSARRGRWLASTVAGMRDRVTHATDPAAPLDEVALAHKVESILFRDPAIEKGNINVNAERDVVFLRGVVTDQDQARDIGSRVERIDGVRSVVNLLRLRGEAPVEAGSASGR